MNTNEYTQQATDFLAFTETKMTFKYLTSDFFFDEDREVRDIWEVTIKNKAAVRKIKFGQSIAACGNKPSEYDILTCITKSDPGTFEEFCYEFGYDSDSRRAEKTYKAVMREWKKVEALFTPTQISLLQEIN